MTTPISFPDFSFLVGQFRNINSALFHVLDDET